MMLINGAAGGPLRVWELPEPRILRPLLRSQCMMHFLLRRRDIGLRRLPGAGETLWPEGVES
jgi:hypothetical protein